MKRLTSILAAALTLSACAPAADPVQSYRDAMPPRESVQLGAPAADGTAAPTAVVALSAPATLTADANVVADPPAYPDQSEFATVSYWSAVGINGGTWWTLTLVKLITDYPATDCDDHACTWGPWLGDDGLNNWKLDVTKNGSAYDWQLSAQRAAIVGDPVAGPWVVLVGGSAHKGIDRHHGHGDFTLYFDAQDSLRHGPGWLKKDFGSVVITYDNTDGNSVLASAIGAKNADPAKPQFMDAAYAFSKTGAGGTIDIAIEVRDDVVGPNEKVSLHTRWAGTGAGRGDAKYSAAGNSTEYLASECWDGAAASWAEVYDVRDGVVAVGAETACHADFQAAVYSVLVPPIP